MRVQPATDEVHEAVGAQPDDELVALARAGHPSAFELLMRRHNQRVYRVVRSVLRDEADIEDVMQQAYLAAFTHLEQFQGTAQWSTWVCRIAINEALSRKRQHARFAEPETPFDELVTDLWRQIPADPERTASGHELRQMVENEMDWLPGGLRAVLIMREIEGMSTAETAAVLGVGEDVVRTRLYRARACLRDRLQTRIGSELSEAFAFGKGRCDLLVVAVLARLRELRSSYGEGGKE